MAGIAFCLLGFMLSAALSGGTMDLGCFGVACLAAVVGIIWLPVLEKEV